MSPRLASFPLLLLVGCAFPVDLGPLDNGFSGAGGGLGFFDSGVPSGCDPPEKLRPYRVTLAQTDVNNPNCWQSGLVPDNHTLPQESFEALLVIKGAQATLGVAGLSEQPLGDVAVVSVGEGVAGTRSSFIWTAIANSRGLAVDDPREKHTTEAIFEFDRLDTPLTAGTLTLTSLWECTPGGPPRSAPCRPAPRDAAGCSVVRNFVAEPIAIPSRWVTPITPPLEGASAFLVSLDLGAVAGARCGIIGQPAPNSLETPRLRSLEVWQQTSDVVRMVPRSYQLGDAPLIEVSSDFGPAPADLQSRTVDSTPSPDMKETRTTSARLVVRPCTSLPPTLQLESSYRCSGPGCPLDLTGNPAHTFCELGVGWFAVELNPTYNIQTSP